LLLERLDDAERAAFSLAESKEMIAINYYYTMYFIKKL